MVHTKFTRQDNLLDSNSILERPFSSTGPMQQKEKPLRIKKVKS